MGGKHSKELIEGLGDPYDGFTDEQLALIFNYFDKDHSGRLSRQETSRFFIKMVKYGKKGYSADHFEAWFHTFDSDDSQELDRKEMSQPVIQRKRLGVRASIETKLNRVCFLRSIDLKYIRCQTTEGKVFAIQNVLHFENGDMHIEEQLVLKSVSPGEYIITTIKSGANLQ